MQKLFVRVRPEVSRGKFLRCGILFTRDWLQVEVSDLVAPLLRAEPALEALDAIPSSGVVFIDGPRAEPATIEQSRFFSKPSRDRCLRKTSFDTLSLAAGTVVTVSGATLAFPVETPVVMPALQAGRDYAVYVCVDGTVRADENASAPAGYDAASSRKIGGFHYGLVAPGTTPAGGGFNTAASSPLLSMVWTQADVDAIAGINQYSIWDLGYRPACPDPRGMACVNGRFWVDLYFTGTAHLVSGTSRAGSDIASGSVLAKIPPMFGGDGSAAYPSLTWYEASEIATAHGKRMLSYAEFAAAAFGVTEAQSLGGSSVTPPATLRQPGYTSRFGLEQATGHVWTWGASAAATSGSVWVAGVRRGLTYGSPIAALFGGGRGDGAVSGSRASSWLSVAWNSHWGLCLRCACDHLQLG